MLTYSPENERLVALLAMIARKDHASFRQLHDLTKIHLYHVSLRIVRKHELADEILQDAYLNIWEKAGSYAADLAAPMTWLITITRNRALDLVRREKIDFDSSAVLAHELAPASAEPAAELSDPHELLAAATLRHNLARCLATLEPQQRQSLALTYYHDMSHSDLSRHLNVPLGTAKAWVRRGLNRLKEAYETLPAAHAGIARPCLPRGAAGRT